MKRRIPGDLIKHLEWVAGSSASVTPSTPPIVSPTRTVISVSANFSLGGDSTFWRVSGINYRGSPHTVDLKKELLARGTSKTQAEWSRYAEDAFGKGEFYTPDFPLQHSFFETLFDNREDTTYKDGIEEIRAWIDQNAKARWLATLTRIKYDSQGLDEMIHNHGTERAYSITGDFVGEDEFVKDSRDKALYGALLGTEDKSKIVKVYKWLTGVPLYIWRVNSKPDRMDQRVAWFGAGSGGAVLGCDRAAESRNASLRARPEKIRP